MAQGESYLKYRMMITDPSCTQHFEDLPCTGIASAIFLNAVNIGVRDKNGSAHDGLDPNPFGYYG